VPRSAESVPRPARRSYKTLAFGFSVLTALSCGDDSTGPVPFATQLAIEAALSSVVAGQPITLTVSLEDDAGQKVANATGLVTVAIESGSGTPGATLSGTLTATAASGSVTFTGLSINKSGTGYRLKATANGLDAATSPSFDVAHGAPAKLVVTTQASDVPAGAAMTAVQFTIQDALDNVATTATTYVTIAVTSGTGAAGATLGGTLSKAAVAGVVTFSDLTIDKAASGYTLAASATNLTGATTSAFAVAAGAPAKLAFSVQPTSAVSAVAMTPALTVTIQDAFGNTTNATSSVTLAIGTNVGSGTLSGTMTVAAVAGVATFSTLSIDKAGTGYTLAATATGLTGATSTAFNITHGAAAKLVFTSQPSNTTSAASIAPALTVTVQDAAGNTVTSSTASITVLLLVSPSGGTLSGTKTVAAVAGVATFSTLAVDKVGTGYVIGASSTGLTSSSTNEFSIAAGAASQLAFSVQPANATAGVALNPNVVVTVQDAAGNTITTSTATINIAFLANPGGASLNGIKSRNAVAGVATFTDISTHIAANGYTLRATATGLSNATSTAFNITAAAASQLVISSQPGGVSGGGAFSMVVTVVDEFGNTVNTGGTIEVSLHDNPASGTLYGGGDRQVVNGVATFATLSINKVGSGYTLSAQKNGLPEVISTPFDVTAGTVHSLSFTTAPSNAAGGATINPAIKVTALDAGGNVATSFHNVGVYILLQNNPSEGTLSGTTYVFAENGVATFSDLSINKAGNGYNLVAGDNFGRTATSVLFDITVGAGSHLVFSAQPAAGNYSDIGGKGGTALDPVVQVSVRDAGGNLVADATSSITLALGYNITSGTLSGTTTLAAVNGVATFTDARIDKVGAYTLTATATGLAGATSEDFLIEVGPPAQLTFSTQPSTMASMTNMDPNAQVRILDAGGNPTSAHSVPVTLAIGTNPSSGTNYCGDVGYSFSGLVNFGPCIDKAGTGYTLVVSSPGLTGATSSPFNVTVGNPTGIDFLVGVSNTTGGIPMSPSPKVRVHDAGGNTVPVNTGSVTIFNHGTTNVSFVNGIATFDNLKFDYADNDLHQVFANAFASGLGGALSETFTVTVGPPAQLYFNQPPNNAVAGSTPGLIVTVRDAGGNLVSSTANISIALGANPAGGTLTGTTTMAAVAGEATFANYFITKAGTGYKITVSSAGIPSATSDAFTILPGAPHKLAFLGQPSNVVSAASISPAIQVAVQDSMGNTLVDDQYSYVYLQIKNNAAGDGALSGASGGTVSSGLVTLSSMSIDKAGTGYTLEAILSGGPPGSSATSSAFNVTHGAASQIAFTTQPTNANGAAAFSPVIKVSVQDAAGNTVTSATTSITVAIDNNGGFQYGGTLSGTTTVAASSGVATFTGLSINRFGTVYTLKATAAGLPDVTSNWFNIEVGPPAQLVFNQTIGNVASMGYPNVGLYVLDAGGNHVNAATPDVTIAIGTNPASGTLSGTKTVAAVNGEVYFNNLQIDKAGTGYTLSASSTGLTGVTSNAFNVTVGVPAQLAFLVQPTDVVEGVAISPAVQVVVQDAGGNTVTSASDPVSMGGVHGTGSTNSVTPVNGIATFSNLRMSSSFGASTISPSYTGIYSSVTSNQFNVLLSFLSIEASGSSACGRAKSTAIYCWGDNTYGQLGTGNNSNSTKPVVEFNGYGTSILADLSGSASGHACAEGFGILMCWGLNHMKQLGNDTLSPSYNKVVFVGGISGIISSSTGNTHTCAVNSSNAAYCWGEGANGRLGIGSSPVSTKDPTLVSGSLSWSTVSSGAAHNCGLTTTGVAYCWGANGNGTLGNGTTDESSVPVAVSVTGGLTFTSISAGNAHTCAIATTTGAAWCWGSQFLGRLGNGQSIGASITVATAVSGGLAFSKISAGAENTCAITTAGALYCWGSDAAIGGGSSSDVPKLVAGGLTWAQVSVGQNFACGVTTAGKGYCWGTNTNGQLGSGNTTNSPTPVPLVAP
jgi:alpha-tubulin suppressor-like RCC1 family protein